MSDAYDVVHVIFSGSQSEVVRGVRLSDGLAVVIKRLREEVVSGDRVARLRREFTVLRQLQQLGARHVPVPVELFEKDGVFSMVTEDIGGVALANMRGKTLAEREVLSICIQCATALIDVHDARILHKDVNSSNIVYNPETGAAQLIDFGLSCVLPPGTAGINMHGRLEGTLSHMAPEQTGRVDDNIDRCTDLYGLGATLYEQLAGRPPFLSQENDLMVHEVITTMPPAPSSLRSSVSPVLEAIALKLLDKSPRLRYRSAYSLCEEFKRCQASLEATGAIADIAVGQDNRSDVPEWDSSLVGRDEVMRQLQERCALAVQGAPQTVFLSGRAGVGCSAVLNAFLNPLSGSPDALVGRATYQRHRQHLPMHGIADALTAVLRHLQMVSADKLGTWRRRLQEAVGSMGQVIVELVPQLEALLGEQAKLRDLGPAESENRLLSCMQRLLGALASHNLLVLCVAEAQYADQTTVRLLRQLIDPKSRGRSHLLLIVAHDTALDVDSPLAAWLAESPSQRPDALQLLLEPLQAPQVAEWLAAALRTPAAALMPLAEALFKKTGGYPQAVRSFVQDLWHRRAVRLDSESGLWRWDLAEVGRLQVSGNVAEELCARVAHLPDACAEALAQSACMGLEIDLPALQVLRAASPEELRRTLAPAIDEGLLLEPDARERSQFTHESVKDRCLERLAMAGRRQVHARLAAYYLKDTSVPTAVDWRGKWHAPIPQGMAWACQVADHVNASIERGVPEVGVDRAVLANCTAGLGLFRGLKYELAMDYADQAMRYLEAGQAAAPIAAHTLARQLQVQTRVALGKAQEAVALLQQDVELAPKQSREARLAAYNRLAHLMWQLGRMDDSIDAGLQAMALSGARPGRAPSAWAANWQRWRFWWALRVRGMQIEDLPKLGPMDDLASRELWVPMATMLLPAGVRSPTLSAWCVYRLARLTVERGLYPVGSSSLYVLPMLQAATRGDLKGAERWVKVMRALTRRLGKETDLYVEFYSTMQVDALLLHPRALLERFSKLAVDLTDLGDLGSAASVYFSQVYATQNVSLTEAVASIKRIRQTAAMQSNPDALIELDCIHTSLKLVQGTPVTPQERNTLQRSDERKAIPALAFNALISLAVGHLLKENVPAALDVVYRLANFKEGHTANALSGRLSGAFFSGVVVTQAVMQSGWTPKLRRLFRSSYKEVRRIASYGTQRLSANITVLDAEMATIDKRYAKAAQLYDLACEQSMSSGAANLQSLCVDLTARFYVKQGNDHLARVYMTRLCRIMTDWGAPLRAMEVMKKYPHLCMTQQILGSTHKQADNVTTAHLSDSAPLAALLVRVSRAFADEHELQALCDKAMSVLSELVGDSRVVILLHEAAGVRVAADSAPGALPQFLLRGPYALTPRWVPNVAMDTTLAVDPYFRGWSNGTFAQAPGVLQNVIRLEIYCENRDSMSSDSRLVSTLDLVAGQLAVAIENLAVYQKLEREVAIRTQALRGEQDSLAEDDAELQMASGFAHEIRTAMASARFSLTAIVRDEVDGLVGLFDENVELLGRAAQALEAGDVAAVAGLLPTVERNQGDTDALLENVKEGLDRAMVVTGQVLEYAQAGSILVGDHHIGLDSMLKELISGISADLQAVHVELRVDAPANLVLPMREEHAFAIVRNLLANARDAVCSKRAEDADRHIALSAQEGPETIIVRVEDSGIGMSKAHQERVFQPFFTGKGARGTGLGLSLSRKLARLYGGDLQFTSEEGVGTTFTLTIPHRDS